MTPYRQAIIDSMGMLAADPQFRLIGYGVTKPDSTGLKAGGAGTFEKVPMALRQEVPVMENLMVGLAVGMSLKGFKPTVFFERCDFICPAIDALVNHCDKIGMMSHGQFRPAVIFRVVVASNRKPLFSSVTHSSDHSFAISEMVSFPVVRLHEAEKIVPEYRAAMERQAKGQSTMLIEYKSNW